MHSLLIIDDDPAITEFLQTKLKDEYTVSCAGSLAAADESLKVGSYDLIILDGSLPDGDGYRYCAKLRTISAHKNTPVIFLTSHAELEDRILGFTLGADDYVGKPFHIEELKLRIAALLKRYRAPEEKLARFVCGDVSLDLRYHKATLEAGGACETLTLTALEFKLLHYLATREGEVCSRDELILSIWGKQVHVTERTIDTHISNLRKKLARSCWTIRSVHNVGYHWIPKENRKTA